MFCVIQQVMKKKPNLYGEHKEIIPYPLNMSINGVEQVPEWRWKWSEERFERPHMEAYKITLHQSYREGGAVRKRQYSVCTMSYYDVCESWWGDFIVGGEKALAEKLCMDPAKLCEIIEAKLEPLRERLEAEFHQSPEYIAKQEHERIRANYLEASSKFCSKYDVDKDEFARCYDVFGVLRNKEYLAKLKAEHKARKAAEREKWRRYQEAWSDTYSGGGSRSYSIPSASIYSEGETAILKQFYRTLAKAYHPDLNPNEDVTAKMQLLNRLKEQWGL